MSRFAIVDRKGNVETTIDGTARDAAQAGREEGWTIMFDESAQFDPPLEEVVDQAASAVQPNPRRIGPELAWERTGYLQIHMDEVMRISAKEAWQRLVPYFPKLLKPRGHRDAGEVGRAWATRESMIENLLSGNYKTDKSFPFGDVKVKGLSLVPASMWSLSAGKNAVTEYRSRPGALPVVSRGNNFNLCVGASAECVRSCLVYSGRNTLDPYNVLLKKAKTSALMLDPPAFGRMLYEACAFHRGTERKAANPMVRLNVYSDIPWELVFPELFEDLSSLQFYDYTKVPDRVVPSNYDLTFSFSGRNDALVESELARGNKAAFVFLDTERWVDRKARPFSPRRAGLPDQFLGREVIDGDISDVRPFDRQLAEGPPPYIVGLKWKSPIGTKADPKAMRFVVPIQEIEGRLVATITPRAEPDTDPDSDTADQGTVEARLPERAVGNPTSAKRRLMR